MLSDRRQRILCALIEEYVAYALPVGSRTITERYHLGVSPATVRNELSALEEAGYITQPHTSAGRIPTDFGYREFVDELLASEVSLSTQAHASLVKELRQSASAIDDLIERTSAELNRLTECLSIVMAPSLLGSDIRQISLVSLSDRSALIVIVTKEGQVINRHVFFNEDVVPERLSSVEQLVSKVAVGHSLADFRSLDETLIARLADDPVARTILCEIVDAVKGSVMAKSSRAGMSTLLKKPEFHDSSSLLPIMEILEDDTVLMSAIDDDISPDNIVVKIGNENAKSQLSGISVIAGIYGREGSQGIIAVIGPKRMNYTKVIGAVRAAKDILDEDGFEGATK